MTADDFNALPAVEQLRAYRARGLCVLRARDKHPIDPWREFQDRLPTDAEWAATERHVEAGGAAFMVTRSSGLAVLDLDSAEAVERCQEAAGEAWASIPRARTPSGGVHLFFAAGAGLNGDRSGDGWDLRAGSGGVMLPLGRDGRRWEVPLDRELADPELLHELLAVLPGAPSAEGANSRSGVWEPLDTEAIFAGVPAGQRDDAAYRFACSLRSRDVGQSEAQRQMHQAWSRMEQPANDPYPLEAALEKVERVYRELPAGRSAEFAPQTASVSKQPLRVVSLQTLVREVERAGDPGWLVEPIWPADAYGALAAPRKAGKTWLDLDLAVSVASGGRWLGEFPTPRGGVLVFLGEGGDRNLVRRLQAIAVSKSLELGDLPIEVCTRAPKLTNNAHLAQIRVELARFRPRLVVIDPFYLSQGAKADGRNLALMGDVLSEIQAICEDAGAALLVVHHYNKTGKGSGPDRFTGSGLQEWARVLVSVDVLTSETGEETQESVAELGAEVVGGEIPDLPFKVTRRLRTEDPSSLTSPIHYRVDVIRGRWHREPRKWSAVQSACIDALVARRPDWTTAAQAEAELPKDRTWSLDYLTKTFKELAAMGIVEEDPAWRPGLAKRWREVLLS